MDGDPAPVAARVAVAPNVYNAIALSTSNAGLLAYRASAEERQSFWVDRSGRQTQLLGGTDAAQPGGQELSPDGHTLALTRLINGTLDVWLIDVERGVPRRFTFDTVRDRSPVWSPDGRRIAFASERTGVYDIYEKPADGTGTETLLVASPEAKIVHGWSSDGRFILYEVQDPQTDRDLWVVPVEGDRKPFPIAHTPFAEANGKFSPDGRWIAYDSNESGQYEVYVQPFPGPGGKLQVSTGGGGIRQWRRDGKELFYSGLNNRVMAAPITVNGATLKAGTPATLFTIASGGIFVFASPDGQRFLVSNVTADPSPVTVLLNWAGGKKVP